MSVQKLTFIRPRANNDWGSNMKSLALTLDGLDGRFGLICGVQHHRSWVVNEESVFYGFITVSVIDWFAAGP